MTRGGGDEKYGIFKRELALKKFRIILNLWLLKYYEKKLLALEVRRL